MYTVISTHDIRKHWKAVSILWGLINNVYRHLHARHTETIDRCYNLIMSHQQCIPSSPRTTYGNYRQMLQSYYGLINNVYRHLHARHTETIDRCYNLIMSHQQCIPWSLRMTYGNTGQLFQSYYVSSIMYTVISTHDIRKQYTAVSILLGLINNVHPDLHERQTETIDRCYNLIFLINNVYRHLHARHTETIDRCYNLIMSHQQCIPWSPRTT